MGLDRRTLRVFLWSLVVTTLAKGSAFLPGYSIDDYYLVLEAPATSALSQGRFGQAALIHILRLLELEPHSARVFFVAFAIVVSCLLATLVSRFWHLEATGWLPVAVASIISIHPFTTEAFTFRAALGIIMCALALLAPLLVPRRWSTAGVIAGAFLLALALSIYQMVLQYCVMIGLMGAAVGLTRVLVVGSASGWPPRLQSLLSWRRMLNNRNAALLACATLGTAGYVLVNAVAVRVLHVTMGKRFGFLPPDRIGERAKAVWNVLRYRFLEPSPLLSQFSKGLLLLLLFAALVGLSLRARPWLLQRRPLLLLLAVVALLAVAVVWTVGIIMVPPTFWPVPRVMSHAGVFWAGTLAISYRCAGSRVRWLLGLLSLLIVLTFIGSSNRILNDQLRLNTRDAAKASRIIARMEASPGFSGTESVVVNGTAPGYPLGYTTNDMDMNLSAFSADWSKLAVLREISGYDLKPAEDKIQKAAAAAYCREVRPWPGPQSVTIQDRLAIVCLGPG
jgi:hypothetical protein